MTRCARWWGLAFLTLGFGLVLSLAAARPAAAQNEDMQAPVESKSPKRPENVALETPSPEFLAGPVDATHYRLGPGDLLSLEWTGRLTRQVPLLVDAEGRVNLPELGVVSVGGRTLESVRSQALGRLRSVYPGARVDIRLVRLRTFKVYVSGQVATPGVAPASGATRSSELFRGPLALREDGSRRNIELRRRDGTRMRVDLDAFALLGRAELDPYLEDGDVLVVPPRRERVHALGAFARPGEYELAPGDSVADLVELAGGLLPGTEQSSGLIVRFASSGGLDSIRVDLGAALERRDDHALQHQDRLYAWSPADYRKPRNATLYGEVRLPGPYPLHGGDASTDRLAAVLARAGGLTAEAARGRIYVFRRGTAPDQRDIEFERLSRLTRSEMTDAEYTVLQTKLAAQQAAFVVSVDELARPDSAFDVRLEDGDVVVVDRETQAVRVAGEVRRPALVEFVRGRTGSDYIALAGGFTGRARRGEVRVSRSGSNQTLLLDDASDIQPGDFIWVPEKKDVNFWGVFKDVLLVAGSVATVIILVRDSTR